MGRLSLRLAALAALALLAATTEVRAEAPGLAFPPTADGRQVVAVDLHVHTVFSDGDVWPTIRVDEAIREGLGAIAITDHLEYEPKKPAVAAVDKGRSYEIAKAYAGDRLQVIAGAEITRRSPTGHVIATFLKDTNTLSTAPVTASPNELVDAPAYRETETFFRALKAAKAQGAFVFWAHPVDPPPPAGQPLVGPVQRRMIADGLIQGVEVANPHWGVMREGLEIALANDLAILGVSDVHKTIEMHNAEFGNTRRSVTLVLAKDGGAAAVEAGLRGKATVALYNDLLIGRERELAPLIGGLLSVQVVEGKSAYFEDGVVVRVRNEGPVPIRLRNIADARAQAVLGEIDLAPLSQRDISVRVPRGEGFAGIRFEVLNAVTDVDRRLEIELKPKG